MLAEFASSARVTETDELPDLSFWADTKPGQGHLVLPFN